MQCKYAVDHLVARREGDGTVAVLAAAVGEGGVLVCAAGVNVQWGIEAENWSSSQQLALPGPGGRVHTLMEYPFEVGDTSQLGLGRDAIADCFFDSLTQLHLHLRMARKTKRSP
jgi:hypothetical protein